MGYFEEIKKSNEERQERLRRERSEKNKKILPSKKGVLVEKKKKKALVTGEPLCIFHKNERNLSCPSCSRILNDKWGVDEL